MNMISIIEAVLFVAGEPLDCADVAQMLDITEMELNGLLEKMKQQYLSEQRGICLMRLNNRIQLKTNELYAPYITKLFQPPQRHTLSQSALETLSIVAYRQPITKSEIEMVRGVKCDYSVSVLLEKRLIYVAGKKDTIGKPNLYGTTDEFLRHFGISTIEDLPDVEKLNDKEWQLNSAEDASGESFIT